jgi:hypothetical protein
VGITAACDAVGVLPGLRVVAEGAAAALAPAVASYTGVLLADTSVPAWHAGRRELPALFAAGAASAAGGLASALTPVAESGPARRLALLGAVGDLLGHVVMDRSIAAELGGSPLPLSRLRRPASALLASGALVLAAAGRWRPAAVIGGLMVTAGAAADRFAVFEAGVASVRDPAYTIGPQRRRLSAAGQ